MKDPPHEDNAPLDVLTIILGAVLVAIILACVVYIANDTEVTRPWPNVERYHTPVVSEP